MKRKDLASRAELNETIAKESEIVTPMSKLKVVPY
jgi:hypothetical protein